MGKKLVSAITVLAMTAGLSAPAFAMGVDRSAQAQVQASSSVDEVGCFRRFNGNVVCGGGGGWGGGGAAAAGLFGGLAAGAIIGGAIASSNAQAQANANAQANAQQQQQYQQWVSYCSSKYRSFDIQSGTYLGADGARHPCQ